MTKTEFKQIDKENEYISNLLEAHKEKIATTLDSFFSPLYEEIKPHGFIFCMHTHYHPIKVNVYDGTSDDSNKLTIEDFKITEQTVDFPDHVLEIVKKWLGGVDA